MAIDFPTTVRLREDEQQAVLDLVALEPLVAKTTVCTGLILVGLDQVRASRDGFQQLLNLLRKRQQGEEVAVPKKLPSSTADNGAGNARRPRRIA